MKTRPTTDNEIIKDKLIEAISIMDEKGRRSAGGNVLWEKDWDKLRELLYECYKIVDKAILTR